MLHLRQILTLAGQLAVVPAGVALLAAAAGAIAGQPREGLAFAAVGAVQLVVAGVARRARRPDEAPPEAAAAAAFAWLVLPLLNGLPLWWLAQALERRMA